MERAFFEGGGAVSASESEGVEDALRLWDGLARAILSGMSPWWSVAWAVSLVME